MTSHLPSQSLHPDNSFHSIGTFTGRFLIYPGTGFDYLFFLVAKMSALRAHLCLSLVSFLFPPLGTTWVEAAEGETEPTTEVA